MDKSIYYARQRPGAADLNTDISNTEKYGEDIVSRLVLGYPAGAYGVVVDGLMAVTNGDDTIDITPGLAYHGTDSSFSGRKVIVATTQTLAWDGTNGQVAPHTGLGKDRIDVVCIRHQYLGGSIVPRYFIDTNPASTTYGRQIVQNVVVDETDSFEFYVQPGTESATPTVPSVPSGYIPLCLVYVRENNAPPYTATITTSGTHLGTAWPLKAEFGDPCSDIDPYYYYDVRYKPEGNLIKPIKLDLPQSDNDNVDIGDATYVHIIQTSTPGAIAITGIQAPLSLTLTTPVPYPKQIFLYNSTGQNLTLKDEEAGSDAANRILTLTGGDVSTTGTGAFTLVYDIWDERWILTSTSA